MIPKTASDVRGMEKAGRLAAQTLEYAGSLVQVGVTTEEIDKAVHDYILKHSAVPAPLNYKGFPKSICTSLNDVICHGVPDQTVLKEGDLINVDVTVKLNGFHGDTSRTFFVGSVSREKEKVTEVALNAMEKGIAVIKPNGTTGDIGFAINKYVTKQGYYVVREIGGHGIGKSFHEEPFVPSFGKKGRGDRLIPFGCITVEPMVNVNELAIKEIPIPNSEIMYYKTSDGTPSAQFEHTVLITDSGYKILTLP